MESIELKGMQPLTDDEMNEVNGGFLGTAITLYRIYRIPPVRNAVNKAVGYAITGAGAYLGYKAATK